jgi:hypothetical protein
MYSTTNTWLGLIDIVAYATGRRLVVCGVQIRRSAELSVFSEACGARTRGAPTITPHVDGQKQPKPSGRKLRDTELESSHVG